MCFFLQDHQRSSSLLFLLSSFLRSVQKLSEFFSSDEIGEELEPRATLTSGSSNHNQNRYQALVSSHTHPHTHTRSGGVFLCVFLSTPLLPPCSGSHAAAAVVFFFSPPFRLFKPSLHPTWCYTVTLQSSSKPFLSSAFSSLSRHLQPLKVVNRKRPPRDDWNNYSSQAEHEREPQETDQDVCIKVKSLKFILSVCLCNSNVARPEGQITASRLPTLTLVTCVCVCVLGCC